MGLVGSPRVATIWKKKTRLAVSKRGAAGVVIWDMGAVDCRLSWPSLEATPFELLVGN